jgi:hypothetical protein
MKKSKNMMGLAQQTVSSPGLLDGCLRLVKSTTVAKNLFQISVINMM